MSARRPRQPGPTAFTHGGARPGAGRKPNGPQAGVSHLARPSLLRRAPVHVILRMQRGVCNLRTRRCSTALALAVTVSDQQDGFRLVQFAALEDQIHLLVEADNQEALSRAMQGLSIRIARALNRALSRQGRIFADRYDARVLRTLDEVQAVCRDLAQHAPASVGLADPDPKGTMAPLTAPRTSLLRQVY